MHRFFLPFIFFFALIIHPTSFILLGNGKQLNKIKLYVKIIIVGSVCDAKEHHKERINFYA
jgi:hypothetical protein